MSNLAALGLSMVLLLAAYPLISFGTTRDSTVLWILGLLLLVAGGLIRRFAASWQHASRSLLLPGLACATTAAFREHNDW